MENEKAKSASNVFTKMLKNKNNLVVGVIAFIVLFGGALYLLSDKGLSESDLVVKTKSGVEFKVPDQWQIADNDDDDVVVAYTENGEDPKSEESDQGLIIGIDSLGVDYNSLSEEQKNIVAKSFDEQFSDPSQLENDGCEKIGDIDFDEVNQNGYDVAYLLEAECLELENRDGTSIMKVLIGIDGDTMHLVAVRAVSDAWDKNGKVFDVMLDSVKPE